jgi:hypothetical protein
MIWGVGCGDESFEMGHVRGWIGWWVRIVLGLVVPVSNYSLGLGHRRPAFVDGSATSSITGPPIEATQYMSQYLMRARGSETGSCGLPQAR